MTTKRILGTETEFGIAVRGPVELDPVSSAILLIGRYPFLLAPDAVWDYENENPLMDLRGYEVDGERERPDPDYNRMLNKILTNGGRLYVDGAHPEYSTPECTLPKDVVLYEKAGDEILEICGERANQLRSDDEKFILYKNNSDGKGNSYGYHENYLVSRSIPFETLLEQLVPFFVTRQIFAGAGKVGAENNTDPTSYQISQRADFFEVLVDLNTMVKRPIMNTRDEPHADPKKYRRLHVIIGDANMSEISTYLKVGTTALVTGMIEEGFRVKGVDLKDPVRAMKQVSRDLTLQQKLGLAGGDEATAIQIQRSYLSQAKEYVSMRDGDDAWKEVLRRWADVLDRLDKDPSQLSRELDWVIKKEMIESYMKKKGCGWGDPRVSMMALQYHDLRKAKGLYYTLMCGGYIERIVTDEEIKRAHEFAPEGTRAYFRSMCLKKFPKEFYAASWSSVQFDIGKGTIKSIPLMEPLRGTKDLISDLLERSGTAQELIEGLAT